VAFLTWVAANTAVSGELLSPTAVVTVLGLLGTLMSVLGNEASIRFGRRRLIVGAMVLSIIVGGLIGFVGSRGYWIAVVLVVVYGMIIWLDSSSLTAGAAGAADPRAAAPRSPCIPCWAMAAASSGRWPSAGRSTRRAACRRSPGASPSAWSLC